MSLFTKLSIKNYHTAEEHDFLCDFKQIEDQLDFARNYTYSEVTFEDGLVGQIDNTFVPIPLKFSSVSYLSETPFFNLQQFLRDLNSRYIFTLTKLIEVLDESGNKIYAEKEYQVFVRLKYESIKQLKTTNIETWEFEIETTSNFFTVDEYDYKVGDGEVVTAERFEYTYPWTLSGTLQNTYANGRINVTNNGEGIAYLGIQIYGESSNPSFGINGSSNAVLNSYASKDVLVKEGEILTVNSFPTIANISKNGENFANTVYVKNHITWCFLPRSGVNTIYFTNTAGAHITVYNQFKII